MMSWWSGIVISLVLVTLSTSKAAKPIKSRSRGEPEFCRRGFAISGKYHSCWQQATFGNEYTGFNNVHVLTPDKLEEYATHMCSVVKPVAMECLGRDLEACSEKKKLLEIADESGGACLHSGLNPYFKLNVIDHLQPIRMDSKCFQIGDSSYNCYAQAGQKVLKSGDSLVGIAKFHKVADKFFNYIWDCHISLFKSKKDVCEDWQIPMLLALQKTAMPSLFGMRLNNNQVGKLELSKGNELITPTGSPDEEGSDEEIKPEEDRDKESESYLLVRVFKDKPQARIGDVVLKLTDQDDQSQMSILSGPSFNAEINELVQGLVNKKGELDFKKVLQKMREERKGKKEIKDYLKKIKNSETKRLNEIKQKKLALMKLRKMGVID